MAQYDVNLREYWRVLRKRKVTVLITMIIFGIFSTIFATVRAPVPLYTAVCSIKFEKELPIQGLNLSTLSWSMGEDIETQLSVITGHEVLLKTAEKLKLLPKGISATQAVMNPQVISVIYNLQDKIEVTREKLTNIINIEVTDSDPVFAQKLANTIALTYKEVHAKEQAKKTLEALNYISNQLKKFRSQLKSAEEEFNLFLQKNQIVSIDLQSETLLTRKKELNDRLQSINEAMDELQSISIKLSQFIKNPVGSGNDFYSIHASKQYQDAQSNLVTLILKRESLLEDYTPRHPNVVDIQRKIKEQAKKMLLMIKVQMEALEKKKTEIQRQMDDVERKTQALMEKKLEYDRLKRKVDSLNSMVALLEQKNQEASIKKAEKPDEVSIVRPAITPASPINPPKTIQTGIMGVVVGLLLGMIIAFIVETFDTSLGAIEDVEETLGTPVLGVISQTNPKDLLDSIAKDKERSIGKEFLKDENIFLVSHFSPNSLISESFRALRTNIQFKDVDKKNKAIGVTSASPQEGKTVVAVNLAITMAQAGLKTLLVGADLRKPIISSIFGIESVPGLTDLLLGNYKLNEVVRTITDLIIGKMGMSGATVTPGLDNLHIITPGTLVSNPAELIDSKAIDNLIEEAKKQYDYIIFDTPPILSTADPLIIGPKLDGMLMVYRIGSVSRGLLKRSTFQLTQVKAKIIGTVLNGMKAEVSPDFQDFKYFKYYYSYGKKKKRKGKKMIKLPRFLIPVLALTSVGGVVFAILWEAGFISQPKNKQQIFTRPLIVKKITPYKKISTKPKIKVPTVSENKTKALSPIKETKTIVVTQVKEKTIEKREKMETKSKSETPVVITQHFPYSIQVGSFKEMNTVRMEIQELKRKGIGGFWMIVDLKNKGRWFRVLTGGFTEFKLADEFRKRHNLLNTRIINIPWTVLITSPYDLISKKLTKIEEMGYSPYYYLPCGKSREMMTSSQKGVVCINLFGKEPLSHKYDIKIFVGAYTYKKNAENLAKRLKLLGLKCKAVLR